MATWYWISQSPGYWSDPVNWAPTPTGGMPPTSTPGTGDVCIFGSYGPGDCYLSGVITPHTLQIDTSYPGTFFFRGFGVGLSANRTSRVVIREALLDGIAGTTWYISSHLTIFGASNIQMDLTNSSTWTINNSSSFNEGLPAFRHCILGRVSCPNVAQTADLSENQRNNSGITFTSETCYPHQSCIGSGILDGDFNVLEANPFLGGDITCSGIVDSDFTPILELPVGSDSPVNSTNVDGGFILISSI